MKNKKGNHTFWTSGIGVGFCHHDAIMFPSRYHHIAVSLVSHCNHAAATHIAITLPSRCHHLAVTLTSRCRNVAIRLPSQGRHVVITLPSCCNRVVNRLPMPRGCGVKHGHDPVAMTCNNMAVSWRQHGNVRPRSHINHT